MKSVTTLVYGLSVVAVGWCMACASAKDTSVSPSVVGDQVTLAVNQSGQLASGVVVRVDSIFDNRCPINDICITGGQANAKLLVSKGTDQMVARLIVGRLYYTQGIVYQDSTGVKFGGQTYKIILRDVIPYPNTTNAANTVKQAIVQVTAI